jgi:hypothetical protein
LCARDDQSIAVNLERVRAHLAVRKLGLDDHLWILRVGDVQRREVLRRGFVTEPHDAPAVVQLLHAHAFADAAESVELVLRDELHVERERGVRLLRTVHCCFSHFVLQTLVNRRWVTRRYPTAPLPPY